MKNFLKIAVLIAVLLAAVFLEHTWVSQSKNLGASIGEELSGTNQEMTMALKIDFGNGEIKNYDKIKIEPGKTVFDLLKKVTEENNLEFSFKEYPDLGVLPRCSGAWFLI